MDKVECVGVDIAKNKFDAYSEQLGSKEFPNTLDGFKKFKHWLSGIKEEMPKVILEATGGYQSRLVLFLQKHNIAVSVLNPKRVRDFAKAVGVFAKTDKIDAKVLAKFGDTICPEETEAISAEVQDLNELVVRRDQLVEQCTQEKNRLEHAKGVVLKDIREHIELLQKRIAKMEKLINDTIDNDKKLNTNSKILRCSERSRTSCYSRSSSEVAGARSMEFQENSVISWFSTFSG